MFHIFLTVENFRWWTATAFAAKNALLAYISKISLTQSDPVPRLASPHLSAKTSDSAVIQPQWVLSLIHRFVPPSGNHTTLLIRLFQDPFVHHTLLLRCFQCVCRFYFTTTWRNVRRLKPNIKTKIRTFIEATSPQVLFKQFCVKQSILASIIKWRSLLCDIRKNSSSHSPHL